MSTCIFVDENISTTLHLIYETQVQLSQTFIQMCQIDNFERKQKKKRKRKRRKKKMKNEKGKKEKSINY